VGDIIAGGAIAARDGAHEPALLVSQRDRDAINFGIGEERERSSEGVRQRVRVGRRGGREELGFSILLPASLHRSLAASLHTPALDPAKPLTQPGFVVGVVDAEHRQGVADLCEAIDGRAADALCGAVLAVEFRVLGFEGAQFAEQRIELGVRHDRLGVDVVGPIRTIEQRAQLGDAGVIGGVAGAACVLGVGHGAMVRGVGLDGAWRGRYAQLRFEEWAEAKEDGRVQGDDDARVDAGQGGGCG
jgi:hypothetical protein